MRVSLRREDGARKPFPRPEWSKGPVWPGRRRWCRSAGWQAQRRLRGGFSGALLTARDADGSRATARPKSAEGRDPDGDPPRQSNRARQYPRNRIRRASSILRDRAALPRSANARSPRKCFRWWGSNCQGSIAIQRLHEPSVFFSGLGLRHKAWAASVRGRGLAGHVLSLGLSFFWHNYTLVYRAIWRLNADQSAAAIFWGRR